MILRSPRTPTGSPTGSPTGIPIPSPSRSPESGMKRERFLPICPSKHDSDDPNTTSTITRQALECEAWNESNSKDDSAWKGSMNIGFKPPKLPCLAINSVDGVHYTAEKMTKEGPTGQMVTIAPGSHTFVKLACEDFLRIGPSSVLDHRVLDHRVLDHSVLDHSVLDQWSNGYN